MGLCCPPHLTLKRENIELFIVTRLGIFYEKEDVSRELKVESSSVEYNVTVPFQQRQTMTMFNIIQFPCVSPLLFVLQSPFYCIEVSIEYIRVQ